VRDTVAAKLPAQTFATWKTLGQENVASSENKDENIARVSFHVTQS